MFYLIFFQINFYEKMSKAISLMNNLLFLYIFIHFELIYLKSLSNRFSYSLFKRYIR